MFELVNPFVHNPAFDQPENNFIEKGISNGVEKGLGAVGDKVLHAGQMKLDNFAQNLPELAAIALICYYVFLGYKTFLKKDIPDLSKIFPVTMIYIIFKLIWKVVLHI